MAVNLPWDIIVDILNRLSVRDLLRYRSVAKPWCSLIDSSEFIKKQLDHAMKTASGIGVVIGDSDFYWMPLDVPHMEKRLNNPIHVKKNPIEDEGETEIVGSCNGLLAIVNVKHEVAIWNPTTRRYRKLPDFEIDTPSKMVCSHQVVYGFGYDHITNDYKFVNLIQYIGCGIIYADVNVYSAKTDGWKLIRNFPYYLCHENGCGVLANNALHWVVRRTPELENTDFIIAFDLEKEKFVEVPMPRFEDHMIHFNVEVFEGLLCMVCNFPTDNPYADWESQSKGVDIWVMKEYGVEASWTKLISVVPNEQIGSFSYILPVAYLRVNHLSGQRILLDKGGKKFITYDLIGERFEDTKMYSTSNFMEWIVSVESLVGLDGVVVRNGWKKSVESKKKDESTRKKMTKKKNSEEKRDGFLSKGFKLVL